MFFPYKNQDLFLPQLILKFFKSLKHLNINNTEACIYNSNEHIYYITCKIRDSVKLTYNLIFQAS